MKRSGYYLRACEPSSGEPHVGEFFLIVIGGGVGRGHSRRPDKGLQQLTPISGVGRGGSSVELRYRHR